MQLGMKLCLAACSLCARARSLYDLTACCSTAESERGQLFCIDTRMPPAAEGSSFAVQVLETVEDRFGQVDLAVQQADTREWEQRNEQRRLAAASQGTTPAKGAAAAQQPLAAASRLLQQSSEAVMQRPAQPLYDSPPSDVIELD